MSVTQINANTQPAVRTKTVPVGERASVEYGGPHRWQTNWLSRLIRRAWRPRAFTRWFDQAISELTVTGLENLENVRGPVIFAPNHSSHLDALVFAEALPERFRSRVYCGAAADRWFRKGQRKVVLQPWYQSLILGSFPILRGGGSKTLDYARWLLRGGNHICIYPEGTRATSDQLGRFRHGVSILALEEQVTIVPVYMSGLRQLRPKGALETKRGAASVEFLAPLQFVPGTSVEDATDALWSAMNAVHAQAWEEELSAAA